MGTPIKADLVEPVPVDFRFRFTSASGKVHERVLVLRPWTIINELRTNQARGGLNALADLADNGNPIPLFEQFCHQLDAPSIKWLMDVFQPETKTPEGLAAVMVERLPMTATPEIGHALIASQSQSWPQLKKKAWTETTKTSPGNPWVWISTVLLFALAWSLASQMGAL